TRPGIATPFAISVATVDGSPLPETVMTRVESAFLDMFDENGLDPTPVSTFQDDRWIWWTFEVPDGASRLTVSFDARLQPTVQSGRTTVVAVEVQGEEAVSLEFHTRVVPGGGHNGHSDSGNGRLLVPLADGSRHRQALAGGAHPARPDPHRGHRRRRAAGCQPGGHVDHRSPARGGDLRGMDPGGQRHHPPPPGLATPPGRRARDRPQER